MKLEEIQAINEKFGRDRDSEKEPNRSLGNRELNKSEQQGSPSKMKEK
jgi:hypothetical protein